MKNPQISNPARTPYELTNSFLLNTPALICVIAKRYVWSARRTWIGVSRALCLPEIAS